ncbi:MAG: DUF2306 domain-containing protein [Alphaproteobacteria bacterium]|nr:DUF2306 domain-containing protein [Alphaproteobacteria bacterium]
MSPQVAIHLTTALAALALGIAMMLRPKGTAPHRVLGRAWVGLMLATAISSLWIPRFLAFSWIHILTAASLASIGAALWAIRRGNVRGHRFSMIGAFTGLCGAALGALAPGRVVGRFVWGLF